MQINNKITYYDTIILNGKTYPINSSPDPNRLSLNGNKYIPNLFEGTSLNTMRYYWHVRHLTRAHRYVHSTCLAQRKMILLSNNFKINSYLILFLHNFSTKPMHCIKNKFFRKYYDITFPLAIFHDRNYYLSVQ